MRRRPWQVVEKLRPGLFQRVLPKSVVLAALEEGKRLEARDFAAPSVAYG
jgi:hypothetical protein